jgi:hypothetical protein
MFRAGTLLLAAAFLSTAAMAQHGGGGSHGGGGARHSGGGMRGARGAVVGRPFPHHHSRQYRGGSYFYPDLFPGDEPYWYDEPYPENEARQPAPMYPPQQAYQPPAEPKLIEIPGAANAAPAKPLPPSIFILTNGEHLETSRFLLRANDLSVVIDRQQRTIPLGEVDLKATVAANHQRGIELEVPEDRNVISLRF